jgi:undecaprenyl-diphosphatase
MVFVTERYTWIPFYLLIISMIIFKERKGAAAVILTIIITVISADLFASCLLKPLVGRLRPCHDGSINNLLHLVPGTCGGLYGFISSHAANTFALITILNLFYRSRYKWISILFLWAIVVSYSRIYLGVHYPGDILAGALSGILWANIFYRIFRKTSERFPVITADSTFS